MNQISDISVIGGGIIGSTIARKIIQSHPNLRVVLFQKQKSLGTHTSTRNSAVIHSGVYYQQDSFKSKFCQRGNELMTQYCQENKIPINSRGQYIMATSNEEYSRLQDLARQAKINEIEHEWIPFKKAKERENYLKAVDQNVESFNVLYTPTTQVADSKAVIQSLRKELLGYRNAQIEFESQFIGLTSEKGRTVLKFQRNSDQIAYHETKYVINCAGLYADEVARQFGLCQNYTILPFQGRYLLTPKTLLDVKLPVQSLIYPVPPQKGSFFLGIHLTTTIDNEIKIGPNAVPALWRQQYDSTSLQNFNLQEFLEICYHNTRNLLSEEGQFYIKHMSSEIRKFSRNYVIKQASRLTTYYDQMDVQPEEFYYGKPGIRAQLVDKRTRKLVSDFIMEKGENSFHLLNVISPGWTCSFAIADHVFNELTQDKVFK